LREVFPDLHDLRLGSLCRPERGLPFDFYICPTGFLSKRLLLKSVSPPPPPPTPILAFPFDAEFRRPPKGFPHHGLSSAHYASAACYCWTEKFPFGSHWCQANAFFLGILGCTLPFFSSVTLSLSGRPPYSLPLSRECDCPSGDLKRCSFRFPPLSLRSSFYHIFDTSVPTGPLMMQVVATYDFLRPLRFSNFSSFFRALFLDPPQDLV